MCKGRAFSFKKIVCFSLIFIGLFSVFSVYLFSKHLRPTIISVSQKTAENEVSRIIDEEIKRLMLEEFLTYDKITVISRDSGGNITSVSANSVLINNFANELDICIGNRIDNTDTMKTDIYLSSLLGMDLLSGIGPKVPLRFQPISVTHADIAHKFEQSGINQTLHTIELSICIDIEILLPMASSTITVVSAMPIAQTLIVGTVPREYFNKN